MSRILWLVWDGASAVVVDDLLRRGELPALASVVSAGYLRPTTPCFPNCQTPPSLATLFTGADQATHGITGFSVPSLDPAQPVTAVGSTFHRAALRTPPVWERLAAAGRPVALSHMPWTRAGDGRGGDRLLIEAYGDRVARSALAPIEGATTTLALGRTSSTFEATKGGQYEVSIPGPGVVAVLNTSPRLLDQAVDVWVEDRLGTRLAVWERPSDGTRFAVSTGLWRLGVEPAPSASAVIQATGPFNGSSFAAEYRAGLLGDRIVDSGDGSAEAAFAAGLDALAAYFERASDTLAVRAADAELLLAYQPVIDEAQHELFRWWTPEGGSSPDGQAAATAATAVVEAAYRLADRHLARLLARIDESWTVVVTSDHGVSPSLRVFHANEALRAAGLLAFDGRGGIDLARTKAVFHPARNGSVWVNDQERPQGIVPWAERGAVAAAAAQALVRAVDPATGAGPGAVVRPPASWFGDLFLLAAPGYDVRSEPHPAGEIFDASGKGGVHTTFADVPSLRGVFAGRGPALGDVAAEGEVDPAHVLSLLGLDDPDQTPRSLAAPAGRS